MAEETVVAAPSPVIPAPPAEDTKEEDKPIKADDESGIGQSVSFKEESNRVSDLEDPEKKALDEFKLLIQDALNKHDFTPPTTDATAVVEEEEPPKAKPTTDEATIAPPAVDEEKEKEVFIWGIPLLGDERSDTILLKFLRARDFKVKEAFIMLRNTVLWRKELGIHQEDLGTHLDKVVFMNGFDKQGHPVCYNVYGEFQNKELYHKTFSDEEKSQKFLRWRIQFLEKSIQKLDFSPGGICTIVQVNDLNNSPGPLKTHLRQATNQALSILQDNYPEFVAKQIFINVPWWYLAFNKMISPFLTLRTKSKFVFSGPSKSAETLFKYIAPEQVPVPYGGLNKQGEQEFSTADAVTQVIVKPATKHTVEIPLTQTCSLVWELRVIGWDVSYAAEFVPSVEDGYTIILQKTRKINAGTDEPVINNTFKIGDPGKVVLTIDNSSSKKKKLLYRFKTKPAASD